MNRVSFKQALLYWLRLGFISFGGPAGQINIMHRELVEQKRWISDARFLHALNYCMVLPGPEAQQLAIYIGWLLHRTLGGLVAGILFVLPSFFILTALAWVYMVYGQQIWIMGLFNGIKPAVVAIVFFASYRMGMRVLKRPLLWGIAISALLAVALMHMPFPLVILVAAMLGYLFLHNTPANLHASQANTSVSESDYVINDVTDLAHTQFNWGSFTRVLAVGLGLWGITFLGLLWAYGADHLLTQMALFFSKAAMLTFGGAYAVLPYVYDGAVTHYHWLTPAQMIDGLALGESTPGPLIMVLTFVGFVGGYSHAADGTAWASALMGAGVATFFTFLPSFVMIFLGAPLIESTHGNLKLTSPLTAIGAAVVGVVLNLALFFTYHVVWPSGFLSSFAWGADLVSVIVVCLSLWLLVKEKWSTMAVIGLGAGLGLFRVLVGAV